MKYKVTLETLTPLHIGTGTELLKDFDYVSQQNTTYVLNQDAVYEHEYNNKGGEARLGLPAGRLVSPDQFQPGSPFVRYTLRGATTIERIHEQTKDIHGRCFVPGSSLKGALRTALFAYATGTGSFSPDLSTLSKEKSGIGLPWERQVFGSSPNNDLLRVLQVADSTPLGVEPSPLDLYTARVFTGGTPGSPIVVEAVRKGVIFELELTIDELTLRYAEKLGWQENQLWIVSLVAILQRVSLRHIQEEQAFAEGKGFEQTTAFYKQLAVLAGRLQDTNAAILQMGWGTGWAGMTITNWLDVQTRNEIRSRYKLGKPPTASRSWQPNLSKPFPASRRLRALAKDAPGQPFGWVALSFELLQPPSEAWKSLEKRARPALKTLKTFQRDSAPEPAARPAAKPSTPPIPLSPVPPRSTQMAAPQPVTPELSQIVDHFSELPKVGDRFRGEVFDVQGRIVYLSLPGLDSDTQAYAVIFPEDNPGGKQISDGDLVLCKVLELKQERTNYWQVRCKRG
jgi:CRISPR-associated protein Csm5